MNDLKTLLKQESIRKLIVQGIREFMEEEDIHVKSAKMTLMDKALYLLAHELFKVKVDKLIEYFETYDTIVSEDEDD